MFGFVCFCRCLVHVPCNEDAFLFQHVEEILGYLQVCVKLDARKTFLCVQQVYILPIKNFFFNISFCELSLTNVPVVCRWAKHFQPIRSPFLYPK